MADMPVSAIVGIKYTKDGGYEYKIVDVIRCTELLGRHLGIFNTDIPPAPPPASGDNNKRVHLHFEELSYGEQQKLTRLACKRRSERVPPGGTTMYHPVGI